MTIFLFILYLLTLLGLLIWYIKADNDYQDFIGLGYISVAWAVLVCISYWATLTVPFMLFALLVSIVIFVIPASIIIGTETLGKKSINYYLNNH